MKTTTRAMDNRAVATQNALQAHSMGKSCGMPHANVCAWTFASDKLCRTCYHYDGQYCNLDGKRYGENYYCSYWRP